MNDAKTVKAAKRKRDRANETKSDLLKREIEALRGVIQTLSHDAGLSRAGQMCIKEALSRADAIRNGEE